jgi:hypothetical protein
VRPSCVAEAAKEENHMGSSPLSGPVTTVVSSVSRITLLEEAIILICIGLLAAALIRHGPKRLHLLLWGFVLMPARDVVFHVSFTFGHHPNRMWAADIASGVSLVGWLLILGYCLTLVWKPARIHLNS